MDQETSTKNIKELDHGCKTLHYLVISKENKYTWGHAAIGK